MAEIVRLHGRKYNQLRSVGIECDVYGFGTSSVLFTIGNTVVHCSVHIQQGVPPFLKGKKTGWLRAEYAMLPSATHQRTTRESSSNERNGRSVEISRLISRCLRSIVDLTSIGEQTIVIDCDILQADGGTRTASITAASLALHKAAELWHKQKILTKALLTDSLAAVSVGIVDGFPLLDIDFHEDSSIDADFNFVMNKSGGLVEIQGTCEKKVISIEQFDQLKNLACTGINELFNVIESKNKQVPSHYEKLKNAAPIFSLQNRLKQTM